MPVGRVAIESIDGVAVTGPVLVPVAVVAVVFMMSSLCLRRPDVVDGGNTVPNGAWNRLEVLSERRRSGRSGR